MAAILRSHTPLRAVRGFSATAVRAPAVVAGTQRKLHITGAKEQSQFLAFESAVQELPRRSQTKPPSRSFNTSRILKANKDSSTIDFAYMPAVDQSAAAAASPAVPLLPDNYLSAGLLEGTHAGGDHLAAAAFSIQKPEISVASLGNAVAALSEADGGAAADALGLTSATPTEAGVVRQVWSGFLDDLFGANQAPKTA